MSRQDLLTIFFGERDRTPSGWLSDAIGELAADHGLAASVILRGAAGYGPHHVEQSDTLLSFSDDLPLVMLAFDAPDRIDAFQAALLSLHAAARISRTTGTTSQGADSAGSEHARVVVLVGRHDRISSQPAHRAVIDLLHHYGAAGASALLGVDGTRDGVRTRSGFLSRNADTPTVVIGIGARHVITRAAHSIADHFPGAAVLVQDVTFLKRDGRPCAEPKPPGPDETWQLAVYASVASRSAGVPLGDALLSALRTAGATGATTLRGIWGYHGDHDPHGDRFWALTRRVPLVTLTASRAEHALEAWKAVDRSTDETGLVVLQRGATITGGAASSRPG